ncbi:AAA family ATPase [Nissabacter archeti]|uniref:AAA family ATPase n=1 Tax=Nissabacter archeti TaxID=1917880 RepID=UPI000932F5A5|nr:ATP-binding protein [Nissabacter archeti]
MITAINEISIPIPYSGKRADLILNGKNLIITGGNGSGKTSFITSIYEFLKHGINSPNNNDLSSLTQTLEVYRNNMVKGGRDDANYSFYEEESNKIESRISQLKSFKIATSENENQKTRSLLRFHKALREAAINPPQSIPRLSALKKDNAHFSNDHDGDNFFENYLISLKTDQSYAISFDKDIKKSTRIQSWFDKIESDMRGLFEDKDLKLRFDSHDGKFYINQKNKDEFTFQTLSSGYSSILRIYADLIMRVEMWELTPDSIEGIIFIDEIDAHLHVSLQKQILRFFTNAFPKIQFIVTTHSPFVVTSVTDAVIYDLTTNDKVNDVSSYSYNVILEQLFGVLPISNVLSDKLEEIEGLSENLNETNVDRLKKLIESIASSKNILDDETSAFVDSAKLKVVKFRKNENKGE